MECIKAYEIEREACEKAYRLHNKISKNGNDMEQYKLGLYYMDELEETDNPDIEIDEAIELFEKAAAQGNKQAKERLEKWEEMGPRKYDPIEDTEQFKAIEKELESKIEAELKDKARGRGFCFIYWKAKAKILKQDYGIKWKSPTVLNPNIMFD
jgi:TPR repeat protein